VIKGWCILNSKIYLGRACLLLGAFVILGIGNLIGAEICVAEETAVQSEDTEYELDTVTVTAEKREEDLQKVPGSVTALSEGQIQDAGMEKTEDIAGYTPNLQITDFGCVSYYTMRGLSNTTLGEPSVGVYVDGVPYSDTFTYNTSLNDVERIEVLRGPQGTLYGKIAQAGVINIITKKPTDNIWQGRAAFGFGNYDSTNYLFSVNGPLQNDRLFLSVAGDWQQREGFMDNTYLGTNPDQKEEYNGRASLRWLPADDWDVTLSLSAAKTDNGCIAVVPVTQQEPSFDVALTDDGEIKSTSNNWALNLKHQTPRYVLTAITTARNWEMDPYWMDFDMTALDCYYSFSSIDIEQFSQELRWQSPETAGKWQWLAGLYYENKQTDVNEGSKYGDDIALLDASYSGYEGMVDRQVSGLDDSSAALFGQVSYALNEKAKVTLGNRLQQDRREIEHTHCYETSSGNSQVGAYSASDTFTNVLPKASWDYQFDANKTTYVSVGKGYKSGGFSRAADGAEDAKFDPEESWNYEVGLKSVWLQNRLTANLAFFMIKTDDYQVTRSITTTSVTVLNAARTTTEGIELEVNARPLRGLDLSGAIGYLHARFDEFTDPDDGTDYSDNKINGVPEYTCSLAAQYRAFKGLFTRAEWRLVGSMYWDEANSSKQDAYQVVNLKIGYETGNYEIYLYGKNVFDEKYYTGTIGMGSLYGKLGDPRTYGFLVSRRF
jgi:iron complex outermembrane receptor protein